MYGACLRNELQKWRFLAPPMKHLLNLCQQWTLYATEFVFFLKFAHSHLNIPLHWHQLQREETLFFQSGNPQPPTIILPPPKDVNLLVPYEHSTFSFNSCSCFCKLKLDSFQNMTFHHLFVLDCPGRQALSKSFSKPWLHIKSNLSADRMNKRLLGLSAHRFLSTVIKNNFENNWEDLTNFPSTCTQLCYSFGPMHVSSKCGTTLTKR